MLKSIVYNGDTLNVPKLIPNADVIRNFEKISEVKWIKRIKSRTLKNGTVICGTSDALLFALMY